VAFLRLERGIERGRVGGEVVGIALDLLFARGDEIDQKLRGIGMGRALMMEITESVPVAGSILIQSITLQLWPRPGRSDSSGVLREIANL
jgi:hypothetical protein